MTTLLKCPWRLVVFLLAVALLCVNAYAVETEEEPGDPVTVIEDVIPEPEPEIPDDEVPEETFIDEDLIEEEAEEDPVIDEIPDDLYQVYMLGFHLFFTIAILSLGEVKICLANCLT